MKKKTDADTIRELRKKNKQLEECWKSEREAHGKLREDLSKLRELLICVGLTDDMGGNQDYW